MKHSFRSLFLLSLFLSSAIAEIKEQKLEQIILQEENANSKLDASLAKENISEDFIQNHSIYSTTQIQKKVPSLFIYPQGSDTFPMISFRGVSSPDYYSSVLGIYVDGIPQSQNFLIQNLSDIQSISIVSGALGILYGENAPLGIISIKTKNPMQGNYIFTSMLISRLSESLIANTGYELKKNLLWGKITTNIAQENGYIRKISSSQMLNSAFSATIGTSLYYQALESLLLTLHYDYHHLSSHKDFYLTKDQTKNFILDNELATWEDFSNGVQNKILNLTPYSYQNAHLASLKLDSDFKNSSLGFLASIQKVDTLANEYPGIYVQDENTDGYYYDTLQVLSEINLKTQHTPIFQSYFGAYYKYLFTENGMRNVNTAPLGYNGNWDANEKLHTFALYGNLNATFKSFSLNFALRYQFFNTSIISHNPPVDEIYPYHHSKNFHAINPAFTLNYNFNPSHQLYFQISNTTKQGGFAKFPFADTDTLPYDPEYLYSTEVGLRSVFRNLQLKIALYGILRNNVQSYVGVGYYKSIKNIGNAYAYGANLSLDLDFSPITFFFNANLGASRFAQGGKNKGSITILGNTGYYDLSSLVPKFAPVFTFNAGLDAILFKKNFHKITLSLLLNFSSSYYLDDFNRDISLTQKPYLILDSYLSYDFLKYHKISIFVQNLTNTRYFTTALWNEKGKAYITNPPINFGLKYSFNY